MEIESRIKGLLAEHPVILFMKGDRQFPRCGFSAHAVHILSSYVDSFMTHDILLDEELRAGLKVFSEWPTFPQLYVNQELIGGVDIMKEMHEAGELTTLFAQLSSTDA